MWERFIIKSVCQNFRLISYRNPKLLKASVSENTIEVFLLKDKLLCFLKKKIIYETLHINLDLFRQNKWFKNKISAMLNFFRPLTIGSHPYLVFSRLSLWN